MGVDPLSAANATLTVFAPTNEAFDGLPAGTLDMLLTPDGKADLVNILTYHVLPVQVLSTDLQASQEPTTLQGSTLKITKDDTGVYIVKDPAGNATAVATVIAADQLATNGVAHVIDGVLIPSTAISSIVV